MSCEISLNWSMKQDQGTQDEKRSAVSFFSLFIFKTSTETGFEQNSSRKNLPKAVKM